MLKKYQALLTRKAVFCAVVLVTLAVVAVGVVETLMIKSQFPSRTILTFSIGLLVLVLVLYLRAECVFQSVMDETRASYHGIEALLYTYPFLKPRLPLPKTRGWAASPDLLNILIERIMMHRPKVVVELGAGTSTVVMAYALEKNNKGKLYSVDNYKEYLDVFHQVIIRHGLGHLVELIHAPLTESVINGKQRTYYASGSLEAIAEIDMLIVDGPPWTLQSHARYPAIPLFFERLNVGAIIIVDDYDRSQDRETVQMWLKEYSKLKLIEESFTEKGTAVLVKVS